MNNKIITSNLFLILFLLVLTNNTFSQEYNWTRIELENSFKFPDDGIENIEVSSDGIVVYSFRDRSVWVYKDNLFFNLEEVFYQFKFAKIYDLKMYGSSCLVLVNYEGDGSTGVLSLNLTTLAVELLTKLESEYGSHRQISYASDSLIILESYFFHNITKVVLAYVNNSWSIEKSYHKNDLSYELYATLSLSSQKYQDSIFLVYPSGVYLYNNKELSLIYDKNYFSDYNNLSFGENESFYDFIRLSPQEFILSKQYKSIIDEYPQIQHYFNFTYNNNSNNTLLTYFTSHENNFNTKVHYNDKYLFFIHLNNSLRVFSRIPSLNPYNDFTGFSEFVDEKLISNYKLFFYSNSNVYLAPSGSGASHIIIGTPTIGSVHANKQKEHPFFIYNNVIYKNFENINDFSYKLFDNNGYLIDSGNFKSSIDLNYLSSGLYLFYYYSNSQKAVRSTLKFQVIK